MMKSVLALAVPTALLWATPGMAQQVTTNPLDGLHQALNLNPMQENAWRTYRAQLSAPNQAQDRRQAAQRLFPTLNAVQRMDLVEAEMKQDLLDLDRQSKALKAFYATLTPDQQRIFDKRTLPPAQNQQGG
jgi:hypothetical protein